MRWRLYNGIFWWLAVCGVFCSAFAGVWIAYSQGASWEDLSISSWMILLCIGIGLCCQRCRYEIPTKVIGLLTLCAAVITVWNVFTTSQPLISSICFLFVGISFVIGFHENKGSVYAFTQQFFAFTIFILAAFALARWIAPLGTVIGRQYSLVGSFAENIGLLCVGLSLICGVIDEFYFGKDLWKYTPSLAWIGLVVVSTLIGLGIYSGRVRSLQHMIDSEEQLTKVIISSRIHEDQNLIQLMAKHLYDKGQIAVAMEHMEDIVLYMQQERHLRTVYIVDKAFSILGVLPVNAGTLSVGQTMSSAQIAFQSLDKRSVEPLQIRYDNANSMLIFFYPFTQKQGVTGYLIALADASAFFNEMFLPSMGYYKREIYIGESLVAVTEKKGTEEIERFGRNFSLDLNGLQMEMRITPSRELVAETASADIIVFTAILGCVLGSLIALLLSVFDKNRARLVEIHAVREHLQEYKDRLSLAIRGTHITTWVSDLTKGEIFWDEEAASNFFGRTDARFVLPSRMKQLLQYVHPEDQARFMQEFEESIATKEVMFSRFRVIHPGNMVHYFATEAHLFLNELGEPVKLAGVCWDVSREVWHQQLLSIQHRVIKKTIEESREENLLAEVLSMLGHTLDLNSGFFWKVNPQSETLRCELVWAKEQAQEVAFENYLREKTFNKGEGIAGEVWDQKKSLWLEHIPQDEMFLNMNIKGILAFPIKVGSRVCAVMVLCKETLFPKGAYEYYVDLMEFLGIEIGEYFQRKVIERTSAELASIVNFSTDPIVSYDTNGIIKIWNRGAELCFKYRAEEMIGSSIEILYREEDKESLKNHLEQIRLGIPIQHLETYYRCKGEEPIPVLVTISPIQEREVVIGASCVIQDISQLRASQESARQREEEFRIFVETTNDWIWSMDASRKIMFSNQKIEAILGYTDKEIFGMDVLLLLQETERKSFEEWIQEHKRQRQGWCNDVREWRHKDGHCRTLEGSAEPVYDEEGRVVGFRGAMKDITERKRIEKLKNEFISMVSHELRTPLTSIQGAVGLLLKKHQLSEDKIRELLSIANHNCDRLMTIINDILELQRMESGKLEISLKPCSVSEFLEEVIRINTPFAMKFGVTLEYQALSTDTKVYSDPGRMMQVMTNLISNGVKFSPKGSKIRITVEELPTMIRFSVQDEGPGISLETKSQLFERFFRGEGIVSSGIPGTGLGLAICKTLLEHLGGRIDFTTEKGKGSTFYFEIPRWFAKMPLLLAKPLIEEPLGRKLPTILYVDSEPELIPVIRSVLSHEYHVVTVDEGEIDLILLTDSLHEDVIDQLLRTHEGIPFLMLIKKENPTKAYSHILHTSLMKAEDLLAMIQEHIRKRIDDRKAS